MSAPVIAWFRRDLRLADNPALQYAVESGRPIIPLYTWWPEEEDPWAMGAASRYWLHQSISALQQALVAAGSRLTIRRQPALEALEALLQESGATSVVWNRRYEPGGVARDTHIKKILTRRSVEVHSANGSLLFEPTQIANKQGKPFKVFTPFWKRYRALGEPRAPLPAPRALPGPDTWPASAELASLALEPSIDWAKGLRAAWDFGPGAAHDRLTTFLGALEDYRERRDRPDCDGVSRLSPYLHFGEISARQIWHAILHHEQRAGRLSPSVSAEAYLRQLVWRDFAHHLLFHFPHTAEAPLRTEFAGFPWIDDGTGLRAWQRGTTGYPIVDAGMRELWATGWMHNRVRMIVASFLTKDLMVHWLEGAKWFWNTLVDADLANNTLGWQWTAGCGADAAPYFRVFNPVTQGRKFDPRGSYIRRWIPELGDVELSFLHAPWEAPTPPQNYPPPLVDHATARQRALATYRSLRS